MFVCHYFQLKFLTCFILSKNAKVCVGKCREMEFYFTNNKLPVDTNETIKMKIQNIQIKYGQPYKQIIATFLG